MVLLMVKTAYKDTQNDNEEVQVLTERLTW